jgi:capsular exopolysaccharide synthesis family protein
MQFSDLLGLLWRRKLLLVFVAMLTGVAGLLAARAAPSRYVAEGLLLFDSQQPAIPELNQFAPISGAPPNQRIRTEADVLRSRRLAEDVARRTPVLPQEAATGPSLLQQATTALLTWYETARSYAGLPAQGPETASATPEPDPMNLQVEELQQRLDIRTTDNSNVVAVRFISTSPVIAASIVNTLMDRYIALDVAAKQDTTEQANRWLTERLAALRKEVEAADLRIQAFRRASGLLETAVGAVSTVQLTEDQTRVAVARQELSRAQAALDSATRSGARGATSEALASPVIQALREREADVVQRAATLGQQLGPRHPDRQAVEAELRDLRRQIDNETGKVTMALRRDVEAARSRLENSQSSLDTSRSSARGGAEASVTLAQLTRDAESSRQVYQAFLLRTEQTRLSSAQFPVARVVSPASVPYRPTGPSPAVIAVFSALAGLLLAAGLVVLRRSSRSTVDTSRELALVTGVQNIGSLPALRNRRRGMPNLVLEDGDSDVAETLRALRINLLAAAQGGHATTLLITSPSAGDGKTTLAVALARLCAADGMRVLLLETDMRRPRIAATLGATRPRGSIEAVLTGRATMRDAIHVDEESGLHCLLSDYSASNPQQLIESAAFNTMVEQARDEYQLVVLDSPPIMRVADAVVLSSYSDMVLFAVGWDRTSSDVLAEAMRRLPEDTRSRTATVFTRVPPGRLDPLSYYAGYAQHKRPKSVLRLSAPGA